eukprot:3062666-Rhodomonas_salina.1
MQREMQSQVQADYLSSYALARRCPVVTYAMPVPGAAGDRGWRRRGGRVSSQPTVVTDGSSQPTVVDAVPKPSPPDPKS